MGERFCSSLITDEVWVVPDWAGIIRKQFAYALSGPPEHYDWRYVRKGDEIGEEEDGTPILADTDMAEILAYRASRGK